MPNWSMNVEYRYTDLGSYTDLLSSSSAGTLGIEKHETVNSVRFGVTYHFSSFTLPTPVVAKY
jgi:opacity protein-like surface antigen